jgi:hypothetical protein
MKQLNRFSRIILLLPVILLAGCSGNYGKKVKHGHVEVFYKDGISEPQAQRTADLLYEADVLVNNNTSSRKSIQLTKQNDTFYFRMVVDEKKLPLVKDETFLTMGSVLSDSIFNGSPVNVDLTNDRFKSIRVVHFKRIDYDGVESDKTNSGNPSDSSVNNQ